MDKIKNTIEFGDFQTPLDLAKDIAIIASNSHGKINTIIEPTCGLGSFIQAFTEIKTTVNNLIGWEINPSYVKLARNNLPDKYRNKPISIKEQDFFQVDWSKINIELNNPILFIGNPPWVTNSQLGKFLSNNLPQKSNFLNLSGLEALTGKSNFDISEWILIKICQQISNTDSAMAFLVKTSVARKVYQYIAQNNLSILSIYIRKIDARKHFNVSVDACLFFAKGTTTIISEYLCPVYRNLKTSTPYKTIGISKGKLISDINIYKNLSDIDSGCEFQWRSGIKHDASKIMEFHVTSKGLVNGLGKIVDLTDDYLYPMYKSSDIAQKILKSPKRMMLVTQKKIGEETSVISKISSKTWNYLISNAEKLDSRKSSIYKNAPRFSIFGVGDYSFKPWKIAISSLYKDIKFSKLGIFKNKPIVLDDTSYMLGFNSEVEADLILTILSSDIASSFINSLIFKDSKRVITASLLNRISLRSIAVRLGLSNDFDSLFVPNN